MCIHHKYKNKFFNIFMKLQLWSIEPVGFIMRTPITIEAERIEAGFPIIPPSRFSSGGVLVGTCANKMFLSVTMLAKATRHAPWIPCISCWAPRHGTYFLSALHPCK